MIDPFCDPENRSASDVCAGCGFSMMGWDEELSLQYECDSCLDEVRLYQRAGKLRFDGYELFVTKIDDEAESDVLET